MVLYPCASSYTDERIADAGPPHTRAHVRAPSAGIDRGWLGSQAFQSASAFNANLGAWNTAAVTTLDSVCGAFPAPGGAHYGRHARRVFDATRAVARGGAADVLARVCAQTCGHAHARVCPCVGIAARSRGGLYACVYMHVHICICIYIINMHTYMCTCARDGYGRACGCTVPDAHVGAMCVRRRCGRRHHVRAWVRPPGYIANAHGMYNIYLYTFDAQSGFVNGCACVFVRTRAIACGR
jgi:hypothetical protein